MFKKQTGRKIDVNEFKKMKRCVECGYTDNFEGEKCDKCKLITRRKCYYCEAILRDTNIYYAYDHSDNMRELESLKLSKKPIKEFLIADKSYTIPYSEDLCQSCHAMQEEIREDYKNIKCTCGCDLLIDPTPEDMIEYIRENGRYCKRCLFFMGVMPELFDIY